MGTYLRQFSTPVSKLVRWLEKSRDRWKEKCQAAKVELKRVQNMVRDVRKSRDAWRVRAAQAEHNAQELQQQLDELKLKRHNR